MDGNFILLILFLGQWCLSVLFFALWNNAGFNLLLDRVAYKIACLPKCFNLPVAGFLFSFLIAPYYCFLTQDTQTFGAPAYLFGMAVFTPPAISAFLLAHKKAMAKLRSRSSIYYMLHFLLQQVAIYVVLLAVLYIRHAGKTFNVEVDGEYWVECAYGFHYWWSMFKTAFMSDNIFTAFLFFFPFLVAAVGQWIGKSLILQYENRSKSPRNHQG